MKRLCRACDMSPDDADDTSHECHCLSLGPFQEDALQALKSMGVHEFDADEMAPSQQEREAELKEIEDALQANSQHVVDNAFAHVWFGDNENGILGASLVDLMHAFLHGVVPCAIQIFLASFTDTEKAALDRLVDRMLLEVHSSERKNFPRVGFSRGITNLKLITHGEWAGVVFTLALVAISKDGHELLESVAERNKKKEEAAQSQATSRRSASQVQSFRGDLPCIVREERLPTQVAYEADSEDTGCCYVDQVHQSRFLLKTERHGVVHVNFYLGNYLWDETFYTRHLEAGRPTWLYVQIYRKIKYRDGTWTTKSMYQAGQFLDKYNYEQTIHWAGTNLLRATSMSLSKSKMRECSATTKNRPLPK